MKYPVRAMLEFAVYGPDLAALERFYCDVFGLEVILRAGDRLTALRCGHSTLLLFDPEVARQKGEVPEHGAAGAGHVAFVIEHEEYDGWLDHLDRMGVAVEKEVEWEGGGTSIYVRDPAGNSVELAPPSLWSGLGRTLIDSIEGG